MSISLLFDTATLILIWIVQLIIYPGFNYYSKKELNTWHPIYTRRISIVVIPLMFGQLISSIIVATQEGLFFHILKLSLIVVVWVLTFSIFVPLHNKIEKTDDYKLITEQLVRKNWLRTIVWTLIFVFSLLSQFYSL